MALTISTLSPAISSGLVAGAGYLVVVKVAWDNSFEATAGEGIDLSSYFPNKVIGGWPIADTLADGGFKCAFIPDSADAPSGGVLQAFGVISGSLTESGPLLLMATGRDLSTMNGQRWMFLGS